MQEVGQPPQVPPPTQEIAKFKQSVSKQDWKESSSTHHTPAPRAAQVERGLQLVGECEVQTPLSIDQKHQEILLNQEES